MLGEYRRSARIVLVANPGFRESYYAPAGPIPAASEPVAAALAGKRLPLAGRIEVTIMEEGQARWLAFLRHEIDFLDICRSSSSSRRSTAIGSSPSSLRRASFTTC